MSEGETSEQASTDADATGPSREALAAQFERIKTLCDAGAFAEGERLSRELLKTAPGHPRGVRTLAETLLWQGRPGEAIVLLAPLAKQYPNTGSVHFRLGNALSAAGRHEEAVRHLRRAVELQPQFPGAQCDLGVALEALGDPAGAIKAYERALALAPDMPAAHANLGALLAKSGKERDAIAHLRRAVEFYPDSADLHLVLGDSLSKTGEDAEALTVYQRAVGLDGKLVGGWTGIGNSQRALGRFAEAVAAYEHAMAISPDARAALYGWTTIRSGVDAADKIDRLSAIVADPDGDAGARRAAAMALANLLDDAGRYDEAFAAAQEGNRLARASQLAANIRFDYSAFQAGIDTFMRVFTPEFFAKSRDWGAPSETPVFIVGHFRTGSTLIEQICASHSQVLGVGESKAILDIASHIHRIERRPDHWTPELFRNLAERHLETLAAQASGKARVVDKMLDNIYHLGLIATMFPRARVIFAHRDGRDTALSVFMRQFAEHVDFATDLLDCGRVWRESERMGAYWVRCGLPLRTHHVQYETLVEDFETEARKLIAFLGLEWEPSCLEFHKTERAVRTASVWQVRQPLYDRSAGRWRHYAKHLGPLCEVLGIAPDAPTGTRPADLV
jgi:tetratricopeptide (TPR) repeat protein